MIKRWLLPVLGLCLIASGPALALDASGYDALLKRHVHHGVVDYKGLGAPAARAVLKRYLAELAEVSLPAVGDRQQQIATLINAYNARVIDHVIDGNSPATIWGRAMFFFRHRWRLFGETMSLDHLEQQIIRKRYNEPRVHFALVCASLSCPPLRSEAYDGKRLNGQLDDQARTFINDAAKNRFDAAAKRLELSMIFQWYGADFAKAAGAVPPYLAHFVPPATAAWIIAPAVTVDFLPYDWSLNGRL
jgi:hypothetical protein